MLVKWGPVVKVIHFSYVSVLINACAIDADSNYTNDNITVIKHRDESSDIYSIISMSQSVSQSARQSVSQSVSERVSELVYQRVSESVSQWVSEWVSETVSEYFFYQF